MLCFMPVRPDPMALLGSANEEAVHNGPMPWMALGDAVAGFGFG